MQDRQPESSDQSFEFADFDLSQRRSFNSKTNCITDDVSQSYRALRSTSRCPVGRNEPSNGLNRAQLRKSTETMAAARGLMDCCVRAASASGNGPSANYIVCQRLVN